ncbi:hypothetical protein [Nocardia sp. NPDC050435]|uniref:hypothetical protein n=1 Tax=Nocardia sp. NPDC050435 TaxID=3155040 RepID=UPI0033C13E03
MPSSVTEPVTQLLRWGLGLAMIISLIWLIIAATNFWTARRDGGDIADSAAGVFRVLGGAIIASSCTVIAVAVMATS